MRKIPSKLQDHLNGEVLTLATCWKLKLRNGQTFGFTNADMDIKTGGITYIAKTGFTPSAIANSSTLAVDNLDVEGMLDSATINRQDVLAGKYDYAEIEIFMLNYTAPQDGIMLMRRGWLGEVKLSDNKFAVEVRGLSQAFSQTIGELFSPSCRARLGDAKCAVVISKHTFSARVTKVISNAIFNIDLTHIDLIDLDNGYFTNGLISFNGGANKGVSMEIKSHRDDRIELVLSLPYKLEINDKFSIVAGCDKRFETCIKKFDNAINFRGEPHVPFKTSF